MLNVPVEFLSKSFIDDPVAPGGTVTLEFTINNLDRDNGATGISFSDSIDPLGSLTGLAPSETLPKAACGGTLDFASGTLTLTGGSLSSEGFCLFSVTLDVPAGATPGTFTNTTIAITATIASEGVTGNTATDNLVVSTAPIFTKEFIDDPVGAGGTVTLRFTITNTASSLSDIEFTDDLNTAIPRTDPPGAIPGLAANSLVMGDVPDPLIDPCGMGSELTVFDPPDIVFPSPIVTPPDPTQLIFTGGSLAPAGSLGDSCFFDVTLDVRGGVPAGTYVNTTSDIMGLFGGAEPVTGIGASADLVVVAGPTLRKEFTDDPVAPGDTVTLEFTLTHHANVAGDATGIMFTDDLAMILPGTPDVTVVAPLPGTSDCGAGSMISSPTPTTLSFTGGFLTGGPLLLEESCTFSVTLQVPAGALPGSHTNTTSAVMATVEGVATAGSQASDDLMITGLNFTKEFIDDPVIPGGTVTLRFTLDNTSSLDASSIIFTDNLNDVLPLLTPDLTVVTPLPAAGCGGTIDDPVGPGALVFSGGSVDAGMSCMFDITLLVPAAAASGTYGNTTGPLFATLGGTPLVLDPATDRLIVSSDLLLLTKSFTDDPVAPGGTATLEFTLSNVNGSTVTDIAFSDDLAAILPGTPDVSASVLPPAMSACIGPGVSTGTITGTDDLTFMGGSLATGETCTISVTLTVPAAAPTGPFPNTTSGVTGDVGGLAVTGDPAIDNLQIQSLTLSKAFDTFAVPGGTVTLTFTIQNLTGSTVSDLSFSDDLDATISGLVATGLPKTSICGGASSMIAGTSILDFSGGELLPLGSCTFFVDLQVPGAATPGIFPNSTSNLRLADVPVAPPATASLTVTGEITNAVTVTADGASAMAQTTDPILP